MMLVMLFIAFQLVFWSFFAVVRCRARRKARSRLGSVAHQLHGPYRTRR